MTIYAEDLPYWKTGQSDPDTWVTRTIKVLEGLGGQVLFHAFGNNRGKAAFLLNVQIKTEEYRVVWPVLQTKSGNERAARIQAATMLYHDVKARAVSAAVLGVRSAFFSFLVLPSGYTPSESLTEDVYKSLQVLTLSDPGKDIKLIEGEIV